MGRYIVKRLLWMIPVILGVTLLVFTLMYFCPGDPASMILGPEATPEQLAAKRAELGLDKGFVTRFLDYIYKAFIKFDLGKSYVNNRSVMGEIVSRFPNTFIIAIFSTLLGALLGIPLGITAATNQFNWRDNVVMVFSLAFASIPNFWLALMASLLFALKLGWLPATGFSSPKHAIMPLAVMALSGMGSIARFTRSSVLDCIRQDYITTARAKGQKESVVIYKHCLRNALIPVITSLGTRFGHQLGGTIVIEQVFTIPGLGIYMTNGISNRDYPVVMGGVLVSAIAFSLVMLLVDIGYAFADPRIKAQYQNANKKKAPAKEAKA